MKKGTYVNWTKKRGISAIEMSVKKFFLSVYQFGRRRERRCGQVVREVRVWYRYSSKSVRSRLGTNFCG